MTEAVQLCYDSDMYGAEAGVDEAGRGSLAGPVCISAVILSKFLETPKEITIKDSKKMSEKKRNAAAEWIKANALSWSVVFVTHEDVDRLNVLNATLLGMRKAVDQLNVCPDFIVVDGPHFEPGASYPPHVCVSGGDDKYRNVAAASILAKTARDSFMREIHEHFPVYNWKCNKAYGTQEHRDAIKEHGECRYHRKTFRKK